jgi:uroporphyrin-III C-methyltransferase
MEPIKHPSRRGFVSLIGAGPGDPDLITVKGLDRLQQADVVLADRLIAPQLLERVDPRAEVIDVGKTPDRHSIPQEHINALMIDKARQGKHVARLKGGDPFVFGRGGEECQALAHAGIPFEVIPGVSSITAVPAYAGIPVTHRGLSSAFTVVAAHTCGTEDLDWEALARSGTLIFLMGAAQLPAIQINLLANGMPADTPIAVIERGTTPEQVVITGSLADILDKARPIQPPATLVVGDVVRLREAVAWFDQDEPAPTLPLASNGTTPTLSPALDSPLPIASLVGAVFPHPSYHQPKDETLR